MRAAVLLVFVLCAGACSSARPAADSERAVAKAVRMGTASLSFENEPAKYSAILTPNAQVEMAFRVSGYVVDLYQSKGADGRLRPLEAGAPVTVGTILARIRPSDYQAIFDKARGAQEEADAGVAVAKAQLAQAEAGRNQAELDFARVSALWEQQSITKQAYDASKAKLEIATAAVQGANAAIEAANKRRDAAQAQTREAQIALGDTEMRAPFGGIVLERRAELGMLAAAGSTAFTLADLETLKARFNVPDFALVGFRPGLPLDLEIDAFPGLRVRGRVLSVAAAADPKARSFEIEVSIPNVELKLRSGMIATVHAEAGAPARRRLQVPASALVHDPTGQSYLVYTIELNGGHAVAKGIPVEPGPLAGNDVVVLSGLAPGQRIVVMGANLLQPGDLVEEVE